ncbi:hypothetical protein [Halobacillus litoralis]|uniref:Uncharacterized protein n=1 Tax=Halobacillus litoralis TaxID=45668 RepID=A0A410MC37_9BACI|nr:hypothetical protein [Halobacillus litoralis]QAS52216.1 hypothetical protein HLI_08220 [Halobacillus litoralis]
MFRNHTIKNVLFKWMPYKEQSVCERKLEKVIKRLKIEDFTFNWDRNSCFIKFSYQGEVYKLEHSIDKAKERGIILRNGLDCLNELTQSLEDLCVIIDRGIYDFDTWIFGMKQSSPGQEMPAEFQEEFHIKYKSSGKQASSEQDANEEPFPFQPETSLRDFEEELQAMKRPQLK